MGGLDDGDDLLLSIIVDAFSFGKTKDPCTQVYAQVEGSNLFRITDRIDQFEIKIAGKLHSSKGLGVPESGHSLACLFSAQKSTGLCYRCEGQTPGGVHCWGLVFQGDVILGRDSK